MKPTAPADITKTSEGMKEAFERDGYFVVRGLIPEPLIDRLMSLYSSQIVNSHKYFFRQSSNRWQRNEFTAHGYVRHSFRDPHEFPDFPEFSTSVLDIVCSAGIRDTVARLTGCKETNVMQSMLFDFNAATPPHQDWYYLDSVPNGHLLAGWFALEDIEEGAGRFYVLPGSNHVDFELNADEKTSNALYQKKVSEYMRRRKADIFAPPLYKGDVLFWSSRTIHGSSETKEPKYSRKSLTAHYLPAIYEFGNRQGGPWPVKYANHAGMKYRVVPEQYSRFSWKNKLDTDLEDFLWFHPRVSKLYNRVRRGLTKASGILWRA